MSLRSGFAGVDFFFEDSGDAVGVAIYEDSPCGVEYFAECEYLPPDESFSDVVYSQRKNEWLAELFDLPNKHAEIGWDGYEAAPLSPESFMAAVSFFWRYLKAFPLPKILVDSNGYVCLKWIKSRNDRLELTFPRTGTLYAVSVEKGERLVSALSTRSQILAQSRMVLGWKG